MKLKGKIASFATISLAVLAGIKFNNHLNDLDKKAIEMLNKSSEPIVATVLSESYENELSPVKKWNGLVSYSNETVKLDSKYSLKIVTNEGDTLGLSVIDGGNIKKESLDMIISEGSRISFPKGNLRDIGYRLPSKDSGETYFTPETQVGTKRADRIKILR